jgi:hypothetical protein
MYVEIYLDVMYDVCIGGESTARHGSGHGVPDEGA